MVIPCLHDRDLNMVRFRDYVPDVGRFTAKDPIGYKGGDADLYGYCMDDPVNGVDPRGLKRWKYTSITGDPGTPWGGRIIEDANETICKYISR